MGWTGKVGRPRATGGRFHGATCPQGCTTPSCQPAWGSRPTGQNTVLEQGTPEMQRLVPPCMAMGHRGSPCTSGGQISPPEDYTGSPVKLLLPQALGAPNRTQWCVIPSVPTCRTGAEHSGTARWLMA